MPLSGLHAHRETARRLLAELKRRPSHAYLFSGPRGVGKALVASALAHALLCERRAGEDFCCRVERCPVRAAPPQAGGRRRGVGAEPARCDCCAACVQIAAGVHPDFTRIGRAANRTDVLIEQVRALIGELGLKPTRSPLRVAIIDDAETLNIPAQNALLKTLEEPPGHAIIFLIASAERVLLDTVRSRVRPVRFAALSTADLEAILAERGIVDAGRRTAAARRARGSAARALALAESEGSALDDLLDALLHAGNFDFVSAQQLAQQHFRNRDEAAENFELIARLLEEVLCSKLLGVDSGAHPKGVTELAAVLRLDGILSCLEGATRAWVAVEAMANPRLQAEQYWMNAAQALRGE
jgi:DNA polymerase III subunit delta'